MLDLMGFGGASDPVGPGSTRTANVPPGRRVAAAVAACPALSRRGAELLAAVVHQNPEHGREPRKPRALLLIRVHLRLSRCRYRVLYILAHRLAHRSLLVVPSFMLLPPHTWVTHTWSRYVVGASTSPLVMGLALGLWDQAVFKLGGWAAPTACEHAPRTHCRVVRHCLC